MLHVDHLFFSLTQRAYVAMRLCKSYKLKRVTICYGPGVSSTFMCVFMCEYESLNCLGKCDLCGCLNWKPQLRLNLPPIPDAHDGIHVDQCFSKSGAMPGGALSSSGFRHR